MTTNELCKQGWRCVRVADRSKVLVADSDSKIRELIRTNLTTDEFEVSEAGTAWDCVKLVWKENPDLIILDLGLPDHDGWEVLNLMRLSGILSDAGVIITSEDFLSRSALRRSQATGFIRKPFDVRLLVRNVQRALAERQGKAAYARQH
ncbi:MAG: response regulator [Chloroflexota bacterium]|nr:MAG: response regulator [Chloroflexota bacterium]